jgi:hypothetical protein
MWHYSTSNHCTTYAGIGRNEGYYGWVKYDANKLSSIEEQLVHAEQLLRQTLEVYKDLQREVIQFNDFDEI